MKLYGEVFDFLSEPSVLTDDVVFVDAKEKKSGQTRRVRVGDSKLTRTSPMLRDAKTCLGYMPWA